MKGEGGEKDRVTVGRSLAFGPERERERARVVKDSGASFGMRGAVVAFEGVER